MGIMRVAAAVAVTAAALSTSTGSAEARGYCGNMTVRGASGRVHVEIDVVRGHVSCKRARAVTAFAWAPAHRDYRGNKFLGDPHGWSCAVGRAAQPATAGVCVRRRDHARVTAFNRDYEAG